MGLRSTLEAIPGVGAAVSAGAILVDMLAFGGDALVSVLIGVLTFSDLLVPMLATLNRLSDRLPFIPSGLVSSALTVALIALFAFYAWKAVNRVRGTT